MQGMTLDYVKVSLGNIFAPGQAYVALSRARSLEGLQVSNVDFSCIKARLSSLSPSLLRNFSAQEKPKLLGSNLSMPWLRHFGEMHV